MCRVDNIKCEDPSCRYILPDGQCALIIASKKPSTEREVGKLLCISRSMVRQIEQKAFVKIKKKTFLKTLL